MTAEQLKYTMRSTSSAYSTYYLQKPFVPQMLLDVIMDDALRIF